MNVPDCNRFLLHIICAAVIAISEASSRYSRDEHDSNIACLENSRERREKLQRAAIPIGTCFELEEHNCLLFGKVQ